MVADPQTRKLARQLVDLDTRLHHLETTPQLAHSSIDDHGVPVYDKDGNLVAIVGRQADGTWGAPPLAGPTPPAPVEVTATGGSGIIHVAWTGALAGGVSAPLDFDALEVLIDGALAGALSDRDGGTVTIQAAEGTRYVSARVRTLVPRHSAATSPLGVQVSAPAEEAIGQISDWAAELDQEIEAERERLSDAEDRLGNLSARPFPSRGSIPPRGAPLGSQWIAPGGELYVRVECEQEVA